MSRVEHDSPPQRMALTPTESRVAALVAEGLTNPRIAQQLGMSVKTVETHLSRVFRKLGINSRGELR